MPHAGRQGATRSLEASDGDGGSSTSRCTLASSGQTPAASRVQLISQSVVPVHRAQETGGPRRFHPLAQRTERSERSGRLKLRGGGPPPGESPATFIIEVITQRPGGHGRRWRRRRFSLSEKRRGGGRPAEALTSWSETIFHTVWSICVGTQWRADVVHPHLEKSHRKAPLRRQRRRWLVISWPGSPPWAQPLTDVDMCAPDNRNLHPSGASAPLCCSVQRERHDHCGTAHHLPI